jgi:hypothetical protein
MERDWLRWLRATARIAAVLGALGAVVLTLRAGGRSQPVLSVLFVLWVLAPFAALSWATTAAPRWTVPTQVALYGVTILLTLFALAVYGGLVHPPAGTAHAFVFLAVPVASWVVAAIVVALAGLSSRRR